MNIPSNRPKLSPNPLQHSCPAPAVWSYRRRIWRVARPAGPRARPPPARWRPPSPSRNCSARPARSGPSARCRPSAVSPTYWAGPIPPRPYRPPACTGITNPLTSGARTMRPPPKHPKRGTNTTPTRKPRPSRSAIATTRDPFNSDWLERPAEPNEVGLGSSYPKYSYKK